MVASDPSSCPACDRTAVEVFFEMPGVPVHCNVFPATAEAARAAPRGDVRLGVCACCGMIHNTSFQRELLCYTADYETSLHSSPRFREYARGLARRLRAGAAGTAVDVVEIGCGKGEFLALLAEGGGVRCVGFDASAGGDQPGGDVRVHRAYYSAAAFPDVRADLVVCRHVLEHVDKPGAFLDGLLPLLKPGALVYLEVPDALFTLRDLGIWDVIYEHCSYFTAPALERLVRAHGLRPTGMRTGFGGQFLCVDARADAPAEISPAPGAVAEVHRLARAFAAEFRDKVAHWDELLARRLDAGGRVALWGAGSKGVTFLNTVAPARRVHAVVDSNARKHGRHVCGTGHRIDPPDALLHGGVDTVLLTNPNYRDEISAELGALGLQPELVLV